MNSEDPAPSYLDRIKSRLLLICDLAALDDDERHDRVEEWQRQALETWKSAQENSDSETATEIVIQSLGDPKNVARQIREPWFCRIMLHYRLHPIRLLLMTLAGLQVSYLESVAWFHIEVGPEGPTATLFFFFGHSFLGAICAMLVWCWRNAFAKSNQVFRFAVLAVAIGAMLRLTLAYSDVLTFALIEHHGLKVAIEGPLMILGAFSLFLAWLSLIAEVCDLPAQKPGRIAPKHLSSISLFVGGYLISVARQVRSLERQSR